MNFHQIQKYSNIAILGRGREGKSTYTFLTQKLGIKKEKISILDQNENIDIPPGVTKHTGATYLQGLEQYDCIFRSPGITDTLIQEKGGIDVTRCHFTSQTQVFFDNYHGVKIGITGTKGKTTISTVLYKTLQRYGKNVILAGNVGKPVLDMINFNNPPEIVVYELSSFMLEALQDFQLDIGLFNTLYSTHTAEHGGYTSYVLAKTKILRHSDQLLIGYQAEEQLQKYLDEISYQVYGKKGKYTWKQGNFLKNNEILFSDPGVLLVGEHNRYNICGIIGILDILMQKGLLPLDDWTGLQEILHTFSGVEHRIEYVGTYDGIKWYNDAIATTPEATVAAIESFKDQIDTLFYGGIDGAYQHEKVADLIIKYHIHNLVLFPDTGEKLKIILQKKSHIHNLHIFETRSMYEAVQFARENTKKGKIALLSCGSPSFSCRSGFEEKGRLFKEAVREGVNVEKWKN